ncbi:RagB/SusD family nutrient uptake outer membrane protein [Persicitalea jodogahamensis]|uniref:Membrane protein n=1 Tax=Persicitalea jodogahamensis TaxID=402147 RepID=A0A8J3D3K3_9BACT|nr:RagB/SusD family nutrient uptake outer membrane protein [Persicitalea jodogahamensis]GHB65889.1 membrane protein [Persicitalea jodogahamensis]
MKKQLIGLSIAILCMIGSSCKEDYLDTVPTASVDASAAFATTKNASAAVNGIYRAMVVRYLGSQGYFGYPAMMMIQDILGEDLVIGNVSTGWHINENRWQVHRSETGNLSEMPFDMYYRIIGNANLAIANIDGAAGPQEDRSRLKGEALGLRAFGYFNLVRLYGKRYDAATRPNSQLAVPLVLEPTTQGLPRSTVEEVYAQINKDLTEAIALLPSSRVAKSHINKEVANGLLARVALTQQNWAAAATYAAAARVGYPLMSIAQYQDGFSDIGNPEWIWGFDHLEDQSEFFGAFHSYISSNYNSSNIRTNPKAINSTLYNKIPETDVRAKMWVKAPTATNTVTPPGGVRVPYHTQKFRLPPNPATSTMGDIPYMRAAEMYLIEAEALAKQGKDADAAKILFDLVSKRDPAYKLSTSTGATLLDEIYFNRRIELWGEGHRFLDLKRLNQPLNRNGANHNPAVAVLFDVPAGDVMWEFLIPRREINSNAAIVQNPL